MIDTFKFTAKIGDKFNYGGNEFKIVDIKKDSISTETTQWNRHVCWDIYGLQVILDNQALYK